MHCPHSGGSQRRRPGCPLDPAHHPRRLALWPAFGRSASAHSRTLSARELNQLEGFVRTNHHLETATLNVAESLADINLIWGRPTVKEWAVAV